MSVLWTYRCGDPFVLELDLGPFNAGFPRMTRPSSIGNGVQFLNRHLSSRLFRDADSMEPLLEFMRLHKYKGQVRKLFVKISRIHTAILILRRRAYYLFDHFIPNHVKVFLELSLVTICEVR